MAPLTPGSYRVRIAPKSEQVVYEDAAIVIEFDVEKERREWRVFVPPHRIDTSRQQFASEDEWQQVLPRVKHYLEHPGLLGRLLPGYRVHVVRREVAPARGAT